MSDEERRMYRTDNEFYRHFYQVRKDCETNSYPIDPDFSSTADYVKSDHPLAGRPSTSYISNGAINFYNYCITLCASIESTGPVTPVFFRLQKKQLGLVKGNIMIDQTMFPHRSDDFVYTASLLYSEYTSVGLINKFQELDERAPEPRPLPPDPFSEKLLKYVGMLK